MGGMVLETNMNEILTRVQESVPYWGVGGRVVWIGLAFSYFLMLQASELFAGERGTSIVFIVCGGGIWRFSEITSS